MSSYPPPPYGGRVNDTSSDGRISNDRPVGAVAPIRIQTDSVEAVSSAVISQPVTAIAHTVPPYAVYVPASSVSLDNRLIPVEEPYPSWFYFTEDVLCSIALRLVPNPMPLQRIHIPALSNDYRPPPQFDNPFDNLFS